jgi:hypothetical protein
MSDLKPRPVADSWHTGVAGLTPVDGDVMVYDAPTRYWGPVGMEDVWRQEINPAAGGTIVVAGALTTTLTPATYFGGGIVYNTAGVQNNEYGWDLGLTKGTWSIQLTYTKNPVYGIATVLIDNVSVGTIDQYAAANTTNQQTSITGISITTSGKKRLTLKAATKNAASPNYYITAQKLALWRTA